MINSLIVALTGAVIASATPALAEGKASAEPAAGVAAPVVSPMTTASADRRRYCVVQDMTGTRMPVRKCRTLAEWRALGVDPLDK